MLKKSGLLPQANRNPTPPDITELHQLLSQALERRGHNFQATWRSVDKMTQYTLNLICNVKGGDPQWQLGSERSGVKTQMFEYGSIDVLLVHNLMSSAVAELAATGRMQSGIGGAVVRRDETTSRMTDVVAHVASQTEPAPAAEPVLTFPTQGDISTLPLDQLLRKIIESKITGKLEVRNQETTALVWVQDGLPVDATASDAEGDDAIIELLTWREGQYIFEPRVLRNSHTVHQSMDALVSQSRQLSERTHYLKDAGMLFTSTLLPKRTNITDLEFVQKAAQKAPMNVEFMNKFYRMLDGKQTVEEMIRAFQLSRIQIVGLIYHLLTNDLIKVSNEVVKSKPFAVQPRVIDGAAIQSVMMSLRRVETGMFIYPAFLYFLEQEYFRCYRSRSPLSVIVFEMRMLGGNSGRQMLPGPAVLDAVLRISQLKRHVDLLAHYDAFDYALLLPNTKANGAQIFANRLVRALTSSPLGGEVDPSKLSLYLGCASIPEDFVDLSSLLGAADLAMAQSKSQKKPVVMYRDIKPITVS
ncbi:hypothetical protein BH10CYA1_BH10CYA1_13940 [soil metagenome]